MLSATLSGVVLPGGAVDRASRICPKPALPAHAVLYTNEQFIESLQTPFDASDSGAVFAWVFSKLPREVNVYPTENYYYFSFYAGWRCYWGNIRLGVGERDRNVLSFCYWEYHDDPRGPEDSSVWVRKFGLADGVRVRKLSRLRYSVVYGRKTVVFRLNRLPQDLPLKFRLERGEKMLARTCDESGFRFFLLFRESHSHFLWVLDEEAGPPRLLQPVTEEILYDRLSGFAFFHDRKRGRKILIGVRGENVRRNNYWDGPFDQLADNFVHPDLQRCIERRIPV